MNIKAKIAAIASILIILLFVPYIITMLLSGGSDNQTDDLLYSGKTIIMEGDNGQTSVDLEQFLIYVLAEQIPADYETEALKAQAVIARTYLYKTMGSEVQMTSLDLSIAYWTLNNMQKNWGDNFTDNYAALEKAVKETIGQCITYEDEYIDALFHRASAGMTRAGNSVYPYLVSKESTQDLKADGALKVTMWTEAELAERLGLENTAIADSIQIVERDSAGYVLSVQIGSNIFSGEEVETALDLNSSCFSFDNYEGKIRITTQGIGHGYGLSQWGANQKAADGYTYEEILKNYFKNISIITE